MTTPGTCSDEELALWESLGRQVIAGGPMHLVEAGFRALRIRDAMSRSEDPLGVLCGAVYDLTTRDHAEAYHEHARELRRDIAARLREFASEVEL